MERILVAIDCGERTKTILACAKRYAKRLDCEIVLCHAIARIPRITKADEDAAIREHFDAKIAEYCDELRKDGVRASAVPTRVGPIARVFLEAAESEDVDALLISVSECSIIQSLFVGAIAERVLRESKRPLFLCHPDDIDQGFKSLLCTVDYSEPSRRSLTNAIELARRLNAVLHVLHVEPDSIVYPDLPDVPFFDLGWPPVDACVEEQLQTFIDGFDTTGVTIEPCLESGKAGPEIVRVTRTLKPDLLIIGKHGHGEIVEFLYGSVAHDVLRAVPATILVIGDRDLPL
jgi:nucleotide-binding universal stress UspA family protein